HRTRIPVEDVAPAAHEKPSESSPKDNCVQDSEDVADKEGQHQMTEYEQVLHDELEKMIAQEVVATALDDATRQAFKEEKRNITSQKRAAQTTSITKLSTGRSSVSTVPMPYVSAASTSTGANAGESSFVYLGGKIPIDASTLSNVDLPIDPNMPDLEDDSDAFSSNGIFNRACDDENVGVVADFNNMDDTINASSAQQALVSYISKQNRTNHKDHQNCLLACFLSQEEPKNISQALQDESWVEAMQEELLQFKLQKVLILVDLPYGKKAIGTKWVFKNKKDERSIVVKNKARLVAQGFRQEEGIDYDEVFAPVARIEAIRLFLAFASYMGFTVYQMDVKSAFLYGTMKGVYVQHLQALLILLIQTKSIRRGELTFFLGLQVKQQPDGIFISQDKYVADILKKFDFWSIRTTSTPIESNKPLVKDKDGKDVDVHVYRSMIGSLMYLTASRPDIMFDVCACARFQVTPKASHLNVVKRIFRKIAVRKDSIEVIIDSNRLNVADLLTKGFDVTRFNILVLVRQAFKLVNVGQVLYAGIAVGRKYRWGLKYKFARSLVLGSWLNLYKPISIAHFLHLISLNRSCLTTLIFSSPTTINSSTMAALESCPKHNMVAYLEKTNGNAEFHEIIDFFTRSYALTISLVVSTTSKTINNVRYITATVAGKPVSISKAFIRSDLQFNDAAGIDVLPNQAIFDTIQLMGIPAFDDLDVAMDFMDNEDVMMRGTMKDSEETDPNDGTAEPNEGTAELKSGNSDESAAPTTVFRDDETIAQFLVTMSQNKTKQKGVEIKEIKDMFCPRIPTERQVSLLRELQEKKREKSSPLSKKEQCGYRHAQLNKKKFEEIQVMYEKVKRANENFIPIGSAKDEKLIEKINEKAAGMDKEEVSEEPESTKVKAKIEEPKENIRKRSGRRLKMKAPNRSKRQKTDSDHEEENHVTSGNFSNFK
ncbi:retrovirus-related pol polyprotein from transposon TNT 1-94, partial [Tanacetum coccineum]